MRADLDRVIALGLAIALLLPWIIQPGLADARPSDPDALTFSGTRITLANGDVFRSDMARITQDSLLVYKGANLPNDALIQLTSTKIVGSHELSEIAKVEVSRSYAGTGAIIGTVGGVVAIASMFSSLDSNGGASLSFQGALAVGMMVMATTAGVGALTGSFFHHWNTVYLGADLPERGMDHEIEAPHRDK